MPIKVVHKDKKWLVMNTDTGKIHGTHPNSKSAYKQWYAMQKNGVDMKGKKK